MIDEIRDSYLTIAGPAEHEIKIKASRFIGLAFPVTTPEQAAAHLDTVRKKEHAATHHCFAWVTGFDREEFKYSDDGEPTGTAGQPIHRVIAGRDLKNTLVIVVRYYGGTKLGTGGLTRAYSGAASGVLDRAGIVEKLVCHKLEFTIPFTLYDRVMRIIHTENLKIIDQEFADDVNMALEIRLSKIESFKKQMTELTGGRFEFTERD